jgi:hypothetical protein
VKLSKLIGLKTRLPSLSPDNWNGHLFTLERRKCVVFVHKATFYSFVVFDILKKDLLDFKPFFIHHFLEQLDNDNLLTEKLKKLIIRNFKTVDLSTTDGDKSAIGYMNDCISRLKWETDGRPPTIRITRAYVSRYYNENLLLPRKTTPKQLMEEALEYYTG